MPTNAEVFLRVLDYVGKEILESVTALLESKKKIGGNHTFFRNWFNLDKWHKLFVILKQYSDQ